MTLVKILIMAVTLGIISIVFLPWPVTKAIESPLERQLWKEKNKLNKKIKAARLNKDYQQLNELYCKLEKVLTKLESIYGR